MGIREFGMEMIVGLDGVKRNPGIRHAGFNNNPTYGLARSRRRAQLLA